MRQAVQRSVVTSAEHVCFVRVKVLCDIYDKQFETIDPICH